MATWNWMRLCLRSVSFTTGLHAGGSVESVRRMVCQGAVPEILSVFVIQQTLVSNSPVVRILVSGRAASTVVSSGLSHPAEYTTVHDDTISPSERGKCGC